MQFVKDTSAADPFDIDEMIRDATGGAGGNKRHGKQESDSRPSKRARVDDEEG